MTCRGPVYDTAEPAARSAVGTTPHGLALLAEILLVGVMTALAALGVVTAFGAFAAGCASLREYLEQDTAPSPRRYLSLLRAASRGAIALLALPVLGLVVAADLLAWRAGMPGGPILGPSALVVSLAAAVVGLRATASWKPNLDSTGQQQWSALLTRAAAETVADWPGSLLITGALAACAVLAFEIPMLTPVLPGMLALAAVVVRGRTR